jgi:hypothetical protein
MVMPMSPQESPIKFKSPFGLDADKALSTPLGIASPLWLAFAGAASAGVAYWWLTRWMRPSNLEAVAELPVAEPEMKVAAPVVSLELEAAPEPVVEAAAETVESVAEAVAEPVIETTIAVVEAEPVVEAAPVIPAVLEAKREEPTVAAPKPATVKAKPAPAAKPAAKASAVAAPKIVAKAKAPTKAKKPAAKAKKR